MNHDLRDLYRGTEAARLWRAAVLAAPLALGLACGGCSLSIDTLDALGGKSEKPEVTGSIGGTKPAAAQPVAMPPERDLVFTKAAVHEALTRGAKDVSLPWENPESGARGTVTPIANAYNQDGATCRDFLASYIKGQSESWMRGEACRADKGQWEVRSIKPWSRS